MRLSATKSLMERRDVVIVASVSCIYGIGDPGDYHAWCCTCARASDRPPGPGAAPGGDAVRPADMDFRRGTFRVRGDVIDIFPAESAEHALRVEMFDDEIEHLRCSTRSPATSSRRSCASRSIRPATT
jgi:excinuclease ABC subunit B